MKKLIWLYCLLLVPTLAFALPELCSLSNQKQSLYLVINNIPSREQWNSTNGYCGEVALISAGLYYGQYLSQYDARRLANLDLPVKNKQLDQILLGYKGATTKTNNVVAALKQMHLNYEQFDNSKPSLSKNFLLWVKGQVIAHHPVAIGVYENTSIFDNNPQPEYDHIVPVFGVKSNHPLLPLKYYSDDVLYFHDNNLYTETAIDCYQYLFGLFQKDRNEANKEEGTIYSLSNNANGLGNFGIAVTGVKAQGVNLLPVHLKTNPIDESPQIKNNSDQRPKSSLITLSIRVSDLKSQQYYILYKYTDFKQLPKDDNFAKSLGNPVKKCSILLNSGTVFTSQEQIPSSSMAIYRAIAAKPGGLMPAPCL